MTAVNSHQSVDRIVKGAMIISLLLMVLSLVITGNPVNLLIVLFSSGIGLGSFIISIRAIDRLIRKKASSKPLMLLFFAKLLVIAAAFYPVSKISDAAVLFFIAGLSAVVLSMVVEGFYQLFTLKRS